jgi:UDP-N-acetylglucosamine diphosphorylase/glucosamine-1-phosphate N-acetyltransferase
LRSSLPFSRIAVFDLEMRENFYPISLTRPTFEFLCGTKSLLQNIEDSLDAKVSDLFVPRYLKGVCEDCHPDKRVNTAITERFLAINSLVNPNFPLVSHIANSLQLAKGKDFVAVDPENNPIFGIFEKNLRVEALLSKKKERDGNITRKVISSRDDRNPPIFHFPWEMISANSDVIRAQASGLKDSPKGDFELLGSKLHVGESAEIQRFVTVDTRNGDVLIDEGARIDSFSHITGPAYIGRGSIIKSAMIREGTSIGKGCRVAGEVEESILFEYTNKNHDGFVGHSIFGSWVNLGALTTNSDLKNTYGNIKVNLRARTTIDTGINKVGCFVGDMCKTAVGTVIMSGKTIGVSAHLFGAIADDVPSFTIYAKSLHKGQPKETYLKSSIETQKRVMERRNVRMTKNYEEMIKSVYDLTAKDRRAKRVSKGKFVP